MSHNRDNARSVLSTLLVVSLAAAPAWAEAQSETAGMLSGGNHNGRQQLVVGAIPYSLPEMAQLLAFDSAVTAAMVYSFAPQLRAADARRLADTRPQAFRVGSRPEHQSNGIAAASSSQCGRLACQRIWLEDRQLQRNRWFETEKLRRQNQKETVRHRREMREARKDELRYEMQRSLAATRQARAHAADYSDAVREYFANRIDSVTGSIRWPERLREDEYARYTSAIDAAFREHSRGDQEPFSRSARELQAACDALLTRLSEDLRHRKFTPDEYTYYKRFVGVVIETVEEPSLVLTAAAK